MANKLVIEKICVLCEEKIQPQHFINGKVWTQGHNAQPMKEGRCCDTCNEEVIRRRIISFDTGSIERYSDWTGKWKKIPVDILECKRQAMMSEGMDCDWEWEEGDIVNMNDEMN